MLHNARKRTQHTNCKREGVCPGVFWQWLMNAPQHLVKHSIIKNLVSKKNYNNEYFEIPTDNALYKNKVFIFNITDKIVLLFQVIS